MWMMTDGHSYQLSIRGVVGTGVAKTEVKGAEDHYAWGTIQHAVGEEPAVMAVISLEGGAIDCVGGLEATARTSPDHQRLYCIDR